MSFFLAATTCFTSSWIAQRLSPRVLHRRLYYSFHSSSSGFFFPSLTFHSRASAVIVDCVLQVVPPFSMTLSPWWRSETVYNMVVTRSTRRQDKEEDADENGIR
eukprot:Gb_11784 [translate_table: standard]